MPAKLKFAAVLAVLAFAGWTAYAQCPADGATPFQAGPLNPKNGFPLWVQDSNGVTLEVCLAQDPKCFFDPAVPGNLYSQRVGFGAEAFWWLAEAGIDIGRTGFSALVVMAVEAAWLTENPAAGDQFPFTRLRFRLQVPYLGKYTVTHPFGKTEFIVDTLDPKGKPERVFESFDIEFAAARQNQGRIGPFLRWNSGAPTGYLGDNVTPHTVTGSPCGTNYFQVQGVDLNGKPLNLDGRGSSVVSTNLFTVLGKEATRAGVGVTRATYTRGAWDPGVEAFAFTRPPTGGFPAQLLSVNVPGNPVAAMTGDSNGRHYTFIEGDIPPSSVTVTNTSDPFEPPATTPYPESSVTVALADTVIIREAYYYRNTSTLDIVAASSDEVSSCPPGVPKLRAYTDDGRLLGELTIPVTGGVELSLPNVTVPPPSVTVKSCFGGSTTAFVDIGKCARAGSSLACKQ